MAKRIFVIDDEKIIGSLIVSWLSRLEDFHVLGSASSGADGIALCQKMKPDILLLDINMPDMCGFEVAQILKESSPDLRIIILSSLCDPFCVYQVWRLDLHGFVDKPSSLGNLTVALREVAAGRRYFTDSYQTIKAAQLTRSDSFHKILTPRELSILILAAGGENDDHIGSQLGISPHTVTTHRRNLRMKIKAHSHRDLIAYAQEWGLIPLTGGKSRVASNHNTSPLTTTTPPHRPEL
jgi:DNA-binding NarL/FixJ family response regulator